MMNAVFTTVATASGDGRNGRTETEDGLLAVEVRIPKEMGGQGGATNPEQLLAAGYAACFLSALKAVARAEKADVDGAQVSATVSIGMRPTGGFGLAAELDIHAPDLDDDTTLALAHRAHELCPYSNAISGNVEVKLSVV